MSEPSQRAGLLAVKLGALVRDHAGDQTQHVPSAFGLGTALMSGGEAWVLLDSDVDRGLGPAVAWALRHEAARLNLVADRGTGALARRAESFRLPVTVWYSHERTLLRALAEPLAMPAQLDAAHEVFRSLIEAGGAVANVEHGVLVGEVEGLEVCRVVVDAESGEARLEVGIGAHDRDAFQLLHGVRPNVEALAKVVNTVSEQRRPGTVGHPLNRLAAERALRAHLVAHPELIGATRVVPAQPPVERTNLKDAVPCVAVASGPQGDTTVVCCVGVDLDVVPFATDARLVTQVEQCVIVMPARDVLPVQRAITAALHTPIGIVPVDVVSVDAPAPITP